MAHQADRITFDYSSPNAAKALHAGHIRSTIIGHVLANIHEQTGATVYRINHINGLGGFGYLIEGYRRWADRLESESSPNDKLLLLYAVRRECERTAQHVYFGFYIDAQTKRKLSSREGASSVHDLLTQAVRFFDKR